MNKSVVLTITSLLSIALLALHLADDIVRGISKPGADNLIAVMILAVWLFGTTVLGARLSGYVIMLLGALFASAMPVVHMTGSSYSDIAKSDGGFFFVWTLLAIGATGAVSSVITVQGLWGLGRNRHTGEAKPDE